MVGEVDPAAYDPSLFHVLFLVVDAVQHLLWDLISWNALNDEDYDDALKKDLKENLWLVPQVRWVRLKKL